MRKIRVLLANADRRSANRVEAGLLDTCYGHAVVECVRTHRVDEMQLLACSVSFQLIVLAADCLQLEPSRNSGWAPFEEIVQAICAIKHRVTTPLIALDGTATRHGALLEAGADAVVSSQLVPDGLKDEVRRALHLWDSVEATRPKRWQPLLAWLHGLDRPRNA